MKRFAMLLTVLAWVTSGCGGSDGPTGPNSPNGPNNGTFTAQIDGVNWSATMILPGLITTSGGGISALGSGSPTVSIAFAWQDQLTTGTWTIGGSGQSVGFNANMTQGNQQWVAGIQGGSGTMTITTRTANRVAGTFSFTMVPSGGGTGSPRQVTNGQFNVTF